MSVIDFKPRAGSAMADGSDGGMAQYSELLHNMYCHYGSLPLTHCAHALRSEGVLGEHAIHQWLTQVEIPVFNVFHKLLYAINYSLMPDKKSLTITRTKNPNKENSVIYEFVVRVSRGFTLRAKAHTDVEGTDPLTDPAPMLYMRGKNAGNVAVHKHPRIVRSRLCNRLINTLADEFALAAFATTGLQKPD